MTTDSKSANSLLAALSERSRRSALQDQAGLLATAAKYQKGRDRSKIASSVVWVFLGLVIAMILYPGCCALKPGLWERTEPATKFAFTLLSSVLLPIVTLVLGYYFGKGNGNDGDSD